MLLSLTGTKIVTRALLEKQTKTAECLSVEIHVGQISDLFSNKSVVARSLIDTSK